MKFTVAGSIERLWSESPLYEPGYRFYLYVRDEGGLPAFRYEYRGAIRDQVIDWCNKNCSRPVFIGGHEMVLFHTEDDALLFYMSFK
jgi:hypothetical protein